MAFKQKKICLLFCAEPEVLGIKQVDQKSLKKWTEGFLELSLVAQVQTEFIWQGNGLDSNWQIWRKLAQTIYKNRTKFDGFVVIHSLDNILYASNLLSFILPGFNKPVIFTCSPVDQGLKNKEFFDEFSELAIRTNLINALQTACLDLIGFNILTGALLVRANRATRNLSTSLNMFIQLDDQAIGQVGLGLQIKEPAQSSRPKATLLDKIESEIEVIEFFPGSIPDLKNMQGLIIKSGQINTWPASLTEQINKLKIPILVFGLIDDHAIKSLNKKKNIIITQDITFEAAAAKFVWSLGQTKDLNKLKKFFSQNLAGELG